MFYKSGVTMKKFCIALCGGIVLTGCSSFSERHQASGDLEYLKEKAHQRMVLPEGFAPLKPSTEYDIPAIGNKVNVNLVGHKLDIRAPSLIMPVAPNSLTSDNTQETQVIFESFLSKEEFTTDLWGKLSAFISQQKYGVSEQVQGSSLSTNSIESNEYFKLLFGLDEDFNLSQKYNFNITIDEQGYKAVVTVKLIDHKEEDKIVELNQFATRRYESRMLNLFLSHVYAEHNQALIADRNAVKKGIKLELGFDDEQNTAYTVHAPYEVVWEKLDIVLPQLGLIVDDRDKSISTYFTHFDKDTDGFWSKLFSWGSSDASVVLNDKEKYQIKLTERGKVSVLTIVDNEGQFIAPEKMTEMLNSFSELMAKEQL